MSHTYEIEIKSLLGSKENADDFRKKLLSKDPTIVLVGKGTQRNHYFNTPDSLTSLSQIITPLLSKSKLSAFEQIVKEGKKVSIRTRDADGKVIFIIKASIGSDTSANGVSRIEFEAEVAGKSLGELDTLLLKAGLTYQAKWSRAREEYRSNDTQITIDKNAGYGYLAEFERVVQDQTMLEEVKQKLERFMAELGATELSQERLERMFAYYNTHWPEYYGTEKTFTVE